MQRLHSSPAMLMSSNTEWIVSSPLLSTMTSGYSKRYSYREVGWVSLCVLLGLNCETGLGQDIRAFLSQPFASSATTVPQPHFNVLLQFAKTISILKGTQEVPEGVLRLGGITETVGTALVALSSFGRKGSSTKSSKARMQHQRSSSISDDDSLYHNLGVSPPRSPDDASKTADVLRRRLSNTMKVCEGCFRFCVTLK